MRPPPSRSHAAALPSGRLHHARGRTVPTRAQRSLTTPHPTHAQFDRLNKRRVSPDEGIRALSAAGVPLDGSEIAQLKAAYSDEAGLFCYDALMGDSAWLAPSPPHLPAKKPPRSSLILSSPHPFLRSQQRAPHGLFRDQPQH